MREILFRGKRKDNGEWVEGNLVLSPNADEGYQAIVIPCYYNYMYTSDYNNDVGFETWYKIEPETVGQFTGLTDKNGKKIFEGDYWIETNGDYLVYVVEFRDGQFGFVCYGITGVLMPYGYDETAGGWDEIDFNPFTDFYMDKIEITGNIHDNPELLKGEE